MTEKARLKPIVLAITDKKSNSYYVLGSNGIDTTSSKFMNKKNKFGKKFREAAS